MSVSSMSALSGATGQQLGAGGVVSTPEVTADRFLKLLVAQMQNQDPLNPMDNAQVTSQMAQINTVAGIDKLNGTVQGLSAQFIQNQAVQSAALIGRDVLVPGNHVSVAEGVGEGAFELSGAAEHVSVEVTGPNGQVLETLQLGKLPAGVHHFNWPAGDWTDASGVKFSVKATTGGGAGRIVDAKPMMQDRVEAVTTSPTGLMLHTQRSGAVDFSSIKTIL